MPEERCSEEEAAESGEHPSPAGGAAGSAEPLLPAPGRGEESWDTAGAGLTLGGRGENSRGGQPLLGPFPRQPHDEEEGSAFWQGRAQISVPQLRPPRPRFPPLIPAESQQG